MAITSVQQWIREGRPYQKGVQIFKLLSDNQVLIELFEEGDDDFNREKLFKELSIFSESQITEPEKSDFSSISKLSKPKWKPSTFPDELRQMAIRSGELTKKIDFNRSRLELLPTKQERFLAAEIIIASVKERQTLYDVLDHYNQHGTLPDNYKPDKPSEPVEDKVQLALDYKNIASRIYKAKKRNDPERVKELEALRIKLKGVLNL